MSILTVKPESLTALGDAIREKSGVKEPLVFPTGMVEAIETIPQPTIVEPVVLTDSCTYGCAGKISCKFIDMFPDKVSTKDITNASHMFYQYAGEAIPFEINLKNGSSVDMSNMFQGATKLEQIPNITYRGNSYASMGSLFMNCDKLKAPPYIYNAYPDKINSIFAFNYNLREIPEDYFDTWNFNRINTYSTANSASIFNGCYSLRKIPTKLLDKLDELTVSKSSSSIYYYNFASYCYSLDEILNLPVYKIGALTGNIFSNSFIYPMRVKRFTFRTNEDGTPIVAQWKSQILDFTGTGFNSNGTTYKNYILNYNSGITADKEVKNDATYQALKNDPDWFTSNYNYSRYNHDSAVETINSLPDTSAYGTNTIKFKGAAGQYTDGGAINTLTSQEIAVASAKGWTVTFS